MHPRPSNLITATLLLPLAASLQLSGIVLEVRGATAQTSIAQNQAGKALKWQEFSSIEGGFSVLMPGTPTKEIEPANPKDGTGDLHQFLLELEGGRVAYAVAYGDVPRVPKQASPSQINQLLNAWRDGTLGKGKLIRERNIKLGSNLGREIEFIGSDGLTYKARIYWVKQRFYILFATATTQADLSQGADKFLNSFKLQTATTTKTSNATIQSQNIQDSKAQVDRLFQTGTQQYRQGQFREALETFQEALGIVRAINERQGEAVTLHSIGGVYFKLGQYPQALKVLEQALVIYREVGNKAMEGVALGLIGDVYLSLGQYPQALKFYQQASGIAKEIGDRASESETLHKIGLVYFKLRQYPQALQVFEQALVIYREVGNKAEEGVVLGNIRDVYFKLRQYPQALQVLEQALVIHREVGNKVVEGVTLGDIGNVYVELDQYPQALKFYQQALGIAKKVNNPEEQERILNNIGLVYSYQHQYAQSLKSFQQALAISKKLGNRADSGATLKNIGDVYSSLGQPSKALDYYQQALEIVRKRKDRDPEGNVLHSIGFGYYELGQYSQALEFYQQSLDISREISDRDAEGETLHNLGLLHDALGQYPQALEFYQQSLDISRQSNDRRDEARTLNNIGAVHNALGQYSKALEFYQQALPILRKAGDLRFEEATLNNIGYALFQTNKLVEAEKTLREGVKISESLRSGLTDADKVSLFDTQVNPYRFLQQVLVAQKKTDAALEAAEQGRARAFVELLATKLSSRPTIQATLAPPTTRQIQQIAKQQSATLVEYSVTYDAFKVQGKEEWRESELYIWVVKPTGEVTFRQADLKPLWHKENTSLYDLVAMTRDSIGVRGRGAITVLPRSDAPQARTRLQRLHELLIKPITDLLPTDPNARVIFVPQGELFLVPFPALQDKSGQYLVEQHTILTAPSIQVLELTRQQQAKVKRAALKEAIVLGNPTMPSVSPEIGEPPQQLRPLPGAEQEAKAIAPLLQTQAILGNKATETTIKKQMSQVGMIHLATHGLLDDSKGLGVPGAIALAPSGQDDGLLTASEILDMKLNAELVVLSACDTGRGRITGDGVIGLSRSLISAGVPSVIASLWSVPDAPTASLMTQFYQNLQQNPDKAQALRQAMLTTMKQHPEPKNWAAFTLIGEAE